MPEKQDLREEEARQKRPVLEDEAEALRGYQRWEFHPTKQYVRRHGWLQPVESFLSARAEAQVSDSWSYLTLPGKDALDIGLFHARGLLRREGDAWPSLAICDRDFGAYVVKRIGVPMKGWEQATIEELLFRPDHRLVRNFPYEVINLDYCGPLLLTANARLEVLRRIAAVRRMFALQRRSSFLLLLTTQDGESRFSSTARDMMTELLRWNITGDERFRARYEEVWGSRDPMDCLADFCLFAQLIVPKVVADCAREWACHVRELFAASYVREDQGGDSYRMICHTFSIAPVGRSGPAMYRPDPALSQLKGQPPLSIMLGRLKAEDLQEADEAYSRFMVELLARAPLDVTDLLQRNQDLADDLEAEALALEYWWEDL